MDNRREYMRCIEDISTLLSAVPIFTLCNVVCGGECCAVGGFQNTAQEQCQKKIRRFLMSYLGKEGEHEG